jgi:hypothetical protein
LSDVARETGKPLQVIERVYHLMMAAYEYGAVLMMVGGKLSAVLQDGEQLPTDLHAEINASYDDFVDVGGAVMRACRRAVMATSE